VFFGYYLVTALIDYIRVATPAEWLRALPGLLIVFAIFLAFAIPTYAVLFGRNKVIVDRYRGRIVEAFDLPFLHRPKRHAMGDTMAVTIRAKTFRTKGHSSLSNAVQILLGGGEAVTVGYEDAIEDAKRLAEHVRGVLAIREVQILDRQRLMEHEEERESVTG
jgi:hypothetical protein